MTTAAGAGWRVDLGDCLRLVEELDDGSVDLVCTDPPYSSGGMFRGDRTSDTNTKYVGTDVAIKDDRALFEGDNRDQRSYLTWCNLWLGAARRKTRPGGLVTVFCDWRQLPTMTDALQVAGWIWRGILVWDKTEGVRPQLGRYRQQGEFVVWGSNGPLPPGAKCAPGVFRMNRDADSREHATGKPVAVMQWLLDLLPAGSLIYDPFMGSGSTGVAALRLGHRFRGSEVVRGIFAGAVERLEAETGAVARGGRQTQLVELLAPPPRPIPPLDLDEGSSEDVDPWLEAETGS